MMKRLLSILLALVGCWTYANADTDISSMTNAIWAEAVNGEPGQEVTISIKMKNQTAATISGYQFTLSLPTGTSYVSSSSAVSSARATTSNFSLTVKGTTKLGFLCTSSSSATFSGTSGEVATIKVKVPSTAGDYTMKVSGALLTSKLGDEYECSDVSTTLHVHNYTYTNNNDGTTHKKVCSLCSTSVNENHTYSDNVCTLCSYTTVSGLAMSENAATVCIGATKTLSVSVSPTTATMQTVTWHSSNEQVATVSSGVVTAVGIGKATITATADADATKTATCTITTSNICVDGIYYTITDATNKKASVTYGTTDYNSYTGDVSIPSTVSINGTTYDVTAIAGYAFCNSTGLTNISIPSSVVSIGTYAFSGCTGMKGVYIEDLTKWCNIQIEDKNSAQPLQKGHNLYLNNELVTTLSIPEGITATSYRAFAGCTSIKKLILPETFTTWGNCSFMDCSNITDVYVKSSSVMTNSNPGAINFSPTIHIYTNVLADYQASTAWNRYTLTDDFDNPAAGSLSTIVGTNPTSLKVSGDLNGTDIKYLRTLINSNSLTSLDMSGANIVAGGDVYYVDGTTNRTITAENANTICRDMFRVCTKLKSISLPTSVTSIGAFAFRGCTALTSITIPEGVTSIQIYTFQSCAALSSVTLPESLTSIGTGAFFDTKVIQTITIPKGVTSIGIRPFGYSRKLAEILVEDGNEKYTSIDGVLYTSDKLTLVQYPYNKSGDSYVVPEGTTTIDQHSFDGPSIKSVDLPSTITKVELNAFRNCLSLVSVICRATNVPTADATAFDDNQTSSTVSSTAIPSKATLKVPYASLDAYRAADVWKNFGTITSIEAWANGDVNNDGKVSIADVAAVVSYLNGKTLDKFNEATADANKDGSITEADVDTIVTLIKYQAVK